MPHLQPLPATPIADEPAEAANLLLRQIFEQQQQILAQQQQILEEQRCLRAELAEIRGAHRDLGGPLVAAIAAAVGSRNFTAAELIQHAEAVQDEALRRALEAIGASGDDAANTVGKYLRRIVGQNHNGLQVIPLYRSNSGWLWMVSLHQSDDENRRHSDH